MIDILKKVQIREKYKKTLFFVGKICTIQNKAVPLHSLLRNSRKTID